MNEAVRSHHKESQKNHQEIVGQLDRFQIDTCQQNNLLTGSIQQSMGLMASRFTEMSDTMIKEMKERLMRLTLENFLSSSNRIDFHTQNGRFQLEAFIILGSLDLVRGPTLPVRKVASES